MPFLPVLMVFAGACYGKSDPPRTGDAIVTNNTVNGGRYAGYDRYTQDLDPDTDTTVAEPSGTAIVDVPVGITSDGKSVSLEGSAPTVDEEAEGVAARSPQNGIVIITQDGAPATTVGAFDVSIASDPEYPDDDPDSIAIAIDVYAPDDPDGEPIKGCLRKAKSCGVRTIPSGETKEFCRFAVHEAGYPVQVTRVALAAANQGTATRELKSAATPWCGDGPGASSSSSSTSSSSTSSSSSSGAVDPVIHVAWTSADSGNGYPAKHVSWDDGVASTVTSIGVNGIATMSPPWLVAMGAHTNGDVSAIFSNMYGTAPTRYKYTVKTLTTSWSGGTDRNFGFADQQSISGQPSMHVSSSGIIRAIAGFTNSAGDTIMLRHMKDDGAVTYYNIDSMAVTSSESYLSSDLAVGADGVVRAVFTKMPITETFRVWHIDNVEGAQNSTSLLTTCTSVGQASLVVDSNNKSHVAMSCYMGGDSTVRLVYASNSGGSWAYEEVATIATGIGTAGGGAIPAWRPDIALDSTGRAHMSYFKSSTNEVRRAIRTAANTYSDGLVYSGAAVRAKMAIDGNDTVYVVWRSGTSIRIATASGSGAFSASSVMVTDANISEFQDMILTQ